MGAINFKPNSCFKTESIFYNYGDIALNLDPNEEYTKEEIEDLKYLYQESEFENAKSLLDNYSFDFFDVELISGYYEGFQLDITPINERDVLQICEFDDKKREWFINSENLDYLSDHYKNKKDIVELINEEIYTIKRDYDNFFDLVTNLYNDGLIKVGSHNGWCGVNEESFEQFNELENQNVYKNFENMLDSVEEIADYFLKTQAQKGQ